jgi:hypothetical protein
MKKITFGGEKGIKTKIRNNPGRSGKVSGLPLLSPLALLKGVPCKSYSMK